MPRIPIYQPRVSIPGEAANVPGSLGAAGAVGAAVADFGKTGMAVSDKISDIIMRRSMELEKQKRDNMLIEAKAKINDEVLNFETVFKTDNKGINAFNSQTRANEFTKTLFDKYRSPDDDEFNNKLKTHIVAQDHALKGALATYEAGQRKDYANDVRALDYESSRKMAANGDVLTALINYRKTLATQLQNNDLSAEDYKKERLRGVSGLYEQYIMTLMQQNDLKSAQDVYKAVKDDLLAETQDKIEKQLKPALTRRTGIDVGTEIFRADYTGKLETMIDAVKDHKLDPEAEQIAIASVKDQWTVRKTDEARVREDAKKAVNQKLNALALTRGDGLNKMSDLSPAEWADLNEKNPEYAKSLQDAMRREQDYLVKQAQAEERAVEAEKRAKRQEAASIRAAAARTRQEKRIEQQEYESQILLDPGFRTRDLRADLSTGRINATQYRSLAAAQQKADPINHDAVKSALGRINAGSALASSLKLDKEDKAAAAVWKNKYAGLVKDFAYNHIGEPDFEAKLNKFVEENVLGEMVTEWFTTREGERLKKFQEAQTAAGPVHSATKQTPKAPGKLVGTSNGQNVYELPGGKWQVGD